MSDTTAAPTAPKKDHGHSLIIATLIAGIIVGVIFQSIKGEAPAPAWMAGFLEVCRFIADLFLRGLKMVIVPLVTGSIISGIAGLSSLDGFARLGLKTWAYYLISSLVAVCVGLLFVNVIQPGLVAGKPNPTLRAAMESSKVSKNGDDVAKVMENADKGAGAIVDIVRRMIPTNVIKACAEGDLLALIFFSILFGAAMAIMPGGAPPALRDVFVQMTDVMTVITVWVMKFTPIAVFCLMVPAITETGASLLGNLLLYLITVVGALATMTFIILPLVLKFLGGVSPIAHFRNMQDALLMSFTTASSSATIPVTLRCVKEESKISDRVGSFVIPLGATVNMNGTALYECVVVVFAAQVLGVDLTIAQQFTVVLLALLTSIGVAGIPAASLVAIIVIMQNAGFSEDMIKASLGLVLAIDRPLDMARTMVNVFGDTVGAVVIAKSEGEKLA